MCYFINIHSIIFLHITATFTKTLLSTHTNTSTLEELHDLLLVTLKREEKLFNKLFLSHSLNLLLSSFSLLSFSLPFTLLFLFFLPSFLYPSILPSNFKSYFYLVHSMMQCGHFPYINVFPPGVFFLAPSVFVPDRYFCHDLGTLTSMLWNRWNNGRISRFSTSNHFLWISLLEKVNSFLEYMLAITIRNF